MKLRIEIDLDTDSYVLHPKAIGKVFNDILRWITYDSENYVYASSEKDLKDSNGNMVGKAEIVD